MEDSPPIKIRSDLYPNASQAHVPQNMTSKSASDPTTVTHNMTPSATLAQQQCSPGGPEKEQKEENSESPPLPTQHYTSPPRTPAWGHHTGTSTDDNEKMKNSPSPSNMSRRSPSDSIVEPSSLGSNEDTEKWDDVSQKTGTPLRREQSCLTYSQGTPYLLPLGVQEKSEAIVVGRDYPSSHSTPVDKTIIPPISFHPFSSTQCATSYSGRSPASSDPEEPIEVGEEETLDLSLSSRSKENKMSHLNSSPTHPPAPFNPFVAFPSLAARFHEMNPMFRENYEQGVHKSPFASSLYGSNLPPHLIPWIISSQIQNLVQQQAARADGPRTSIMETCNGGIVLEERDQQPLDLSAKRQEEPKILTPEDDLVARVLEIKPSTRGRRRADNSKRSYTDFELHAALREIQSGKLGTRKAAVKYGIPRSTLRNKVYKLQLVRDSVKSGADQKDNLRTILPDSTGTCRAPQFPPKPAEPDAGEDVQSEALKSIIRKKMTEKLSELSRSSQTFLSGGDQQRLVDSALSYLFENIPKLALNSDNKAVPSDVLSSLSLYPQLHDFTQKIVEERFYEELKRINNNSTCDPPRLSEVSNGYNFDSGAAPINIPTYPSLYKCNPSSIPLRTEDLKSGPNSSHPTCASPPQGNLKDMIAQIINQKILGEEVQAEIPNSAASSPPFLPISVQRMDSSFLKTGIKLPDDGKSQQDQNKKRAKSPSSGGGKGSRPKRGKYRNYDRDNLLKAVQAVQSGEMSVHRAGSFYGVPHSTLEYKVKERHLNRGKSKKDANVGVTNVPLLKSEKENSTLTSALPTSAFSKEYKTDTPDTTTRDLLGSESRCNNDEISIISVHSPPTKKVRMSDQNETYTNLPIPSNPFLSGPFPFWNNTSPILAPFLSNPYQADSLYASQVMSNFQKAASKFNNLDSRHSSPSPNNSEEKYAETTSNESSLNKIQGLFSNGGGGGVGVGGGGGGGSISSTPPSSPPVQDGLLNTLLRKNFETQLNEGRVPWSVSPASTTNQNEELNEHNKGDLDANAVPQPGLLTLKALLPSFIAARTSLAAAAAIAADASIPTASSKQSSSPPQPASPIPLIKDPTHRPVLGGVCGTSLSETQ